MSAVAQSLVGVALLLALVHNGAGAPGEAADIVRANELIKNRQYNDAVKLLSPAVQGQEDARVTRHHLLLGECNYLLKKYDEARGHFIRVTRNSSEPDEKRIAEYRLACVAFRLGEFKPASERMDAFLAAYPTDARCGVLLTFKMQIAAQKGKDAETEIVALHERIIGESRRYGAAAANEADEILCDFYRSIGQEDKAVKLYSRIVSNYRRLIADLEREKQPIPPAYEKTHDNAALQLGILAAEKKQYREALQWLEQVRYDAESKVRARLLMARMSYEKGDYAAVVALLADKAFMEKVEAGPARSDVFLMLGLAERQRSDTNAGRAEEWLRQVSSESRGYAQAQASLGDLYRDKGLQEQALRAYASAMDSPDHAPAAMLGTGLIILDRAEKEPDADKQKEMTRKGAEALGQVAQRFPLTAQARTAKEKLTALAQKGVDVGLAAGAEEMLKGWEKVAMDKPGTAEAAQALAQIVRMHARTTLDDKTKKVLKGPAYLDVAAAADKLLDEKVYGGQGMAEPSWKALRSEVLYQRAIAELASLAPSAEMQATGATYLRNASADRAAAWLRAAQQLIDPKQLEMVKGIELALLEALFKSDRTENREQAEKRFAELEADYGNDPRFTRLSLELAEFYRIKGKLVEAADQYAGTARRARDLPPEDVVRLWYTAGTLYSRAAYESQQAGAKRDYGIYLYPRDAILLRIDDAVRADPRFARELSIRWPRSEITAGEAIAAISRASGIAFVWPTGRSRNGIASYFAEKRLSLKDGKYTAEAALALVLDAEWHRVGPHIGLADGAPTIEPRKKSSDDTDADSVYEIYDLRQEAARLKALARGYGNWRSVHAAGNRGRDAGVLLYDVLQRIEQLTGVHVAWAEGLDRQAKLGVEIRERDLAELASPDASCGAVLGAVLTKADLRFRIVSRDLWRRYYEQANKAFNESRKLDPTGKYAEKSLFAVAVNYYNLRDYARMKQVLKTYLKLFDNPENESYQQACFWIGYALEQEKKPREAMNYYARAAEERLVIIKADETALTSASLKSQLSVDSQIALAEPLQGTLQGATLNQLADFVQVNTHVSVRIDPAISAAAAKVDRGSFRNISALELLAESLKPLGLTCRVENAHPESAEKAYFRLASVYNREGMQEQALENCALLLGRYPKTERRREVTRLMLDIHRGLGDFAQAMATLEELRKTAADAEERRRLEADLAALRFEMADYESAARGYQSLLAAVGNDADKALAREGYARSLLRLGKQSEALAEYEALLKEEAFPLAGFADSLIVFQLKYAAGKVMEREFPEDAMKYILEYEKLSDNQRERLSAEQRARVAAIYFTLGLIDADKKRFDEAARKLDAARNSPDELLGGEAGVQLGLLHLNRGEFAAARDAFELLLLNTRSNESRVRGMYYLGLCLEKLGRPDDAGRRFAEVVRRYPASPLARRAMQHPSYASPTTRPK